MEGIYREKPYRIAAQAFAGDPPGGVVQPGSKLLDGTASLTFRPLTLYVTATTGKGVDVSAAGGGSFAQSTPPVEPNVGSITVQLRGIFGEAGWYLRRFTLAPFRMVELDVSTFADVQIEVLRSDLEGFDIRAVANNRPVAGRRNEPLFLAEEYPLGPGTYAVPPGAVDITPRTSDPFFTWGQGSAQFPVTGAVGSVTVPDPQFAGVLAEVKAMHFTTTIGPVPAFGALWRIAL